MDDGRVIEVASRQDCTQFEDSLRRLHALEKKLTDQVQLDIAELRQKWIQVRVDRVTHHTFKLYQVREHLKTSKVLYVEEEQILGEFNKVKEGLVSNFMDDDTFEATQETCMVLGGKLGNIRNRQNRCYSDTNDLELVINKEIMTLKFEDKDFEDLDINQVRASTPVRQLSPTPLERHRSRSREPSEFRMPAMNLCTGTTTPGGSIPPDPHAYFSRPNSSQSMYGGRGVGDVDAFRAAMEAKQAEADSPMEDNSQNQTSLSKSLSGNIVIRSADGHVITQEIETEFLMQGGDFISDRPGSAMSDMSIDIGNMSRPGSKLEFWGDDISGTVQPFSSELECKVNKDTNISLMQNDGGKNANGKAIKDQAEPEKEIMEEEKIKEENRLEENVKEEKMEKEKIKEDKIKEEKMIAEIKEEEKKKQEKIKEEKSLKEERIKEERIKEERMKEENMKKERMSTEKVKEEKKKEEKMKVEKIKEEKMKEEKMKEAKMKEEKMKEEKMKEEKMKEEKMKDEKMKKEKMKEEKIKEEKLNEEKIKEEEKTKEEKLNEEMMKKEKLKEENMREENMREENIKEEKMKEVKVKEEKIKEENEIIDKEQNTIKDKSKKCTVKLLIEEEDHSQDNNDQENKTKMEITYDDIDSAKFDKALEPITLAKEIFAEIVDASEEAGLRLSNQQLSEHMHRTSKFLSSEFKQEEPAEWNPEECSEFDNEDELMIILNEEEPELVDLGTVKSRSQSKDRSGIKNHNAFLPVSKSRSLSQNRPMSTGFSHLDEFERKLAEMELELENEEALKLEREASFLRRADNSWNLSPHLDRATNDNPAEFDYSDNKVDKFADTVETQLARFENEVINSQEEENSKNHISNGNKENFCYESEDDVVSEYIFDEITGQSIKRYKKVSFVDGKEQFEIENQCPNQENSKEFIDENLQPKAPKRSRSRDPSPAGFISAMTGGLVDPNKNDGNSVFGSLIQLGRKSSRSRSRHGSRQSSRDRNSLGSEDEGSKRSLGTCDSESDAGSENSLGLKMKKLTKKKQKVQATDFDQLFARGLAKSTQEESENNKLLVNQEESFKMFGKQTGIGYSDKVKSFLVDQGQKESTPSHVDLNQNQEHVSRERGRKKNRANAVVLQTAVSVDLKARSISTEVRNRSRSYAKPEDIKLSPVPKRDLFTGLLVPESPEAMFLQRVTAFVAKNQAGYIHKHKAIQETDTDIKTGKTLKPSQPLPDGISPLSVPEPAHTHSPGKSFLDASTGQDVFSASIEGDFIEINPGARTKKDIVKTINDQNSQIPTQTNPVNSMTRENFPPRQDEPADKGIPCQLMPDKLLANEEFYENLRSGMTSIRTNEPQLDETQEDAESYQKYSHHLGRAEFGTLKKRTSVIDSRDLSGDRVKTNVVSRDTSTDNINRKFNSSSSKLSHQSSMEQGRSDSRMSDYSSALPDLEVEEAIRLNIQVLPIQRTQSLLFGNENEGEFVMADSTAEALVKREEVLKDIDERKQQIKDTKAWIQNGLMTVVGFGVMAYLQTLEAVAGGQ